MKIINFTDQIAGQRHLEEALFYVCRQFYLYHTTRNVLFYQNALDKVRLLKKVVDFEISDSDNVQSTLNLFNNETGLHGSQKNETHEEYWKDYFNR